MKKLIYLFAIIALGFTSCGDGKNEIIGTWQLDSVSTEELTASEKEAMLLINADGTCEQKRGEHFQSCTWKLSDDGKTLTVSEGEGDEKTYADVVVTGDKFSFSDRGATVTFKRK